MSDDNLMPAFLRRDPAFEEQLARLWAMTADERVAAMRAGQLSLRLLCAWSARCPHEVPLTCTGSGLQGGEFEWLAMLEPSIAEPATAQGAPPPSAATDRPPSTI